MSGKLPIDRVRESEHAPRLLEQHKRDFAQEQAELRDAAPMPPEQRPSVKQTGEDERRD